MFYIIYQQEMPVPDIQDQVDGNINKIIEKEILSQTYLQINPVILTNSRRDIKVHNNIFLDTGSDTTLVRKDIADKLKLTGIRTMNISNAVRNTRKISSQVLNFIITPQTNKCDCFQIDDACLMSKFPSKIKLNLCYSFDRIRPCIITPPSRIENRKTRRPSTC